MNSDGMGPVYTVQQSPNGNYEIIGATQPSNAQVLNASEDPEI